MDKMNKYCLSPRMTDHITLTPSNVSLKPQLMVQDSLLVEATSLSGDLALLHLFRFYGAGSKKLKMTNHRILSLSVLSSAFRRLVGKCVTVPTQGIFENGKTISLDVLLKRITRGA